MKHGLHGTTEYICWKNMHQRCRYEKHIQYKDYGGRGIKVCTRWKTFQNFIKDMGLRPSPKHTLDRIDNHKGYSKNNCRWADRFTQTCNTRKNVKIKFKGQEKTLEQWARKFDINSTTISRRLKRGWPVAKAFQFKGSTRGYVDYHAREKHDCKR